MLTVTVINRRILYTSSITFTIQWGTCTCTKFYGTPHLAEGLVWWVWHTQEVKLIAYSCKIIKFLTVHVPQSPNMMWKWEVSTYPIEYIKYMYSQFFKLNQMCTLYKSESVEHFIQVQILWAIMWHTPEFQVWTFMKSTEKLQYGLFCQELAVK